VGVRYGVRVALAALAASLALPALAVAEPKQELDRGTPLEQAREEAGIESHPRGRFGVPVGELRISPTELVAARSGQKLRFTVELERPADDASLLVTLPRAWLARGVSGLPTTRAPLLRRRANGHARLRRAGRTVELAFDSAASGQLASFDVTDVGIPAGTYRLPFSWRYSDGRVRRAGVARVVFYAPAREGPEEQEGPFGRLSSPGVAENATGDSSEESETFIAVTHGDSDRIAVGVNWFSASMAAWISGDRGQNWVSRVLPESLDAPGEGSPESGNICCDPMFASDSLGNIWFGGLAQSNGGTRPSRIVVNRIAAGTNTFQAQTVGLQQRTSGTQDKPMMTIDDSPSSPTYGRLYVVWDEPSAGGINIVISQCDTRTLPGKFPNAGHCDNADNWTAPVDVTPATGSYIYADVAVGPDGKVYATWWDYSSNNAIRGLVCNPASQNCASAAGWGTPQTIATLDSTGGQPIPFACPIVAQPGGRDAPTPQVDVDHSGGASNGRVYVTWSDLRPGSGSTRCDDNLAPATTHLTWDSFVGSAAGALPASTSPSASVGTKLITDGEGGGQSNSDDWFAWLAVDQTSGQAWADLYSTRDDSTRQTTNFYARSVTPSGGGHTLGSLTKVSSGASDYSSKPCCTFGNDYGDYEGLDATEGAAFPAWTDNSSGTGDGEAFTYVSSSPSLQLVHQSSTVAEAPGTGDGDGTAEPGETMQITEQVQNTSSVGATGVTGTLSSPVPAVTITQGSSAYPNIGASGSGSNSTPFQAAIDSEVPCGSFVDFRLAFDTGQGNEIVPFRVQVQCTAPDTTPPETTINSGPSGPTNDSTPTFGFSSSEAGSTFQCHVVDAGSFAGCTSPHTVSPALADGPHTFEVEAKDAANNTDPTPATRSFTVDTNPPDVTIVTPADGSTTNDSTPTLSGAAGNATGDASTVTVKIYSGSAVGGTLVQTLTPTRSGSSWSTTPSPALDEGTYTAQAQQGDSAGNTGTSPQDTTFAIDLTADDTTPPDTILDSGPSGTVSSTTATFTFHADEGGSSFQCQLDSVGFSGCASPVSYAGLADGPHTFEVRATDAAGNTDPTPAQRIWTVAIAPVAGAAGPTQQDQAAQQQTQLSTPLVPLPDLAVMGASVTGGGSARLGTALARGLRFRIGCAEPCAADLRLLLSARDARSVGLARSVEVGRATAGLPAGGSRTAVVRFKRRARRALAKRRSVRLTLRTVISDSAGNRLTLSRRLTLRR
jgi:Bacterial Ig-like domain